MATDLHQSSHVWNSELSCFISTKHEQLAQILQDYNPYFSLVFIPPAKRDATDTKPFAILDSSPGRPPYIVRYLSTEEIDDTGKVLAWVFEGDLNKHRPADVFSRIEARERAEQVIKAKAKSDRLEEDLEFADFAFGSRAPHTFNHNGQTYRS